MFTVNASSTEVAGLGCKGGKSMIVMNVTIFGKSKHLSPYPFFHISAVIIYKCIIIFAK